MVSITLSRVLVFLTALPWALGHLVSHDTRALPRDLDPFYKPPAGFESKDPGTILRTRRVVVSFFGLIPDPVEGFQLLFRTNSVNGSAIASATTIFKPAFAKTDRLVSFQTAYDSSASKCDPSYSYQLGTPQEDLVSSAELVILQGYLLSGYMVVSTDYEGPDAAFTAGRMSGMGVLDGIRAAQNFDKLGLKANPMVVGVGYSGGAIATGWAAGLQPSYAPELSIKGWVSGGTPANLTGVLVYIDKTSFSGFLPAAVDGLLKPSAYLARLGDLVDKYIQPAGRRALAFANNNCAPADIVAFANQSIFDPPFQSLGRDLLYLPRVEEVLQENIMGVQKSETPTAPVYLYHSAADEIIPYTNVTTLDKAWCSNGATVKFVTYSSGSHAATEASSFPAALKFVKQAFAGGVTPGCESTTVSKKSGDFNSVDANVQTVEDELQRLLKQMD